ncbi:large ribosomal subunit protein bL28 [Candidatus Cytomitobacter primus]|uniref:Large ribosomal subunit protein bL28 n=1 Tax=Candidatus Cytomitobacter primus TaxID=2066024 RepID=A0A5C0UH30_9PROT|nr:bL28 family ribosomal protein [Candidatus Cytomitobacter primus]QEK38344.1 50S ribosomal protein L28 [Candidatus Cytomitobacter primus]
MRDCLITGYRIQFGHNVSHANNKTRRIFLANVHSKYILSEKMGKVKVSISHRGERTLDKYGGLDQFLLNAKNRRLTVDAKVLKRKLAKQTAKQLKKAQA